MTNPLTPFLDRDPTAEELAAMGDDALRELLEAAEEAARLDQRDLNETKRWGRSVARCVQAEVERRRHAG